MVTEDRFKIKLGELDSASRTCVLFLIDEINKLKVKKTDIHPDVFKALMQHEKEIKGLVEINNMLVEGFDSLEKHYNIRSDLPKKIGNIILEDVKKELNANKKIMDENIAKANMEFRKIEEIRDGILAKFIIIARRLNIELSLTDKEIILKRLNKGSV